ncbi:MAG: glycosyltransferase family 2 protein [Clostridia bacterium]|nr:glycosyltransferase family 2 protein [Clostridia bacterium]
MDMGRFAHRVYMKIRHEALRLKVKGQKWQYGVTKDKRTPQLIVSFTSYPKRFMDLELCIKSMVNQQLKADRIILWLGNDASLEDEGRLVAKYGPYGVEIIRDPEQNLRSHKKYYYALRDLSEHIIVLADDDLIYPADWLSSLYASYQKHPDCVSARRVHRITFDEKGNPLPYLKWDGDVHPQTPSHALMATTGAGALFPPKCLIPEVLNRDVFMGKARTADDIFLKFMEIKSGVKVAWARNNMTMPTTVNLNQDEELTNINVLHGTNDIIFRDLWDHYHMTKADFS